MINIRHNNRLLCIGFVISYINHTQGLSTLVLSVQCLCTYISRFGGLKILYNYICMYACFSVKMPDDYFHRLLHNSICLSLLPIVRVFFVEFPILFTKRLLFISIKQTILRIGARSSTTRSVCMSQSQGILVNESSVVEVVVYP